MIAHEPQHLSDAELMQLIDAEPRHGMPARAHDAHAAGCDVCTARVQSLRDDAALVRQWFDIAAFETDDGGIEAAPLDRATHPAAAAAAAVAAAADAHRSGARSAAVSAQPAPFRGWLRAAAVLLMLAAPVAALPQLRHWVVDAVTGGAAVGPTTTSLEPPSTQSAQSAQSARASFRFVPAGGTFAVEFDELPAGGTLTLRRADGDEAELEVGAPLDAPGAGPVLSASSVRLRNDAASSASYVLSVPSSVSTVTVTAAGRTLRTFDRAAIAGIVVLQFGGRPRS